MQSLMSVPVPPKRRASDKTSISHLIKEVDLEAGTPMGTTYQEEAKMSFEQFMSSNGQAKISKVNDGKRCMLVKRLLKQDDPQLSKLREKEHEAE